MSVAEVPAFVNDKHPGQAIFSEYGTTEYAKHNDSEVDSDLVKTDDGAITREEAAALLDPAAEKALKRKMDIRVVLPVGVIFFWAFVDRINIGYANLQGLQADLGMSGNDFNVALLIQIAPFIFFEIPSNLIIKRVRPSLWLSGLSIGWGFMTLGQGLVKSYEGFLALRFMLGVFEAGLVPGAVYLVSMYYTRAELQKRMVALYIANCVAIATGGLIAIGMTNLQGVGGLNSWRWIYIVEGIITIGLAIMLVFLVTDWPVQAKWLSPHEKRLLAARQIVEDGGLARMDHLNRKSIFRILKDWKIYSAIVIYFCVSSASNATAFVPGIIARLGYSNTLAQVLTVPIYFVAALLAYLAAILSDRINNRFIFCIIGVVLCIIGYALLLNTVHIPVGAQYAALYFFNAGSFMLLPTLWTWLSNNMGGHYKRSWSAAAQIGLGNAGALVPTLTLLPAEAPTYTRAFIVLLALIVLAGLTMIGTEIALIYENRMRDQGKRDYRLQEPDVNNMGDDHPSFRFTY